MTHPQSQIEKSRYKKTNNKILKFLKNLKSLNNVDLKTKKMGKKSRYGAVLKFCIEKNIKNTYYENFLFRNHQNYFIDKNKNKYFSIETDDLKMTKLEKWQ